MPYKSVRPDDLFDCQMCGECCQGFGGTYVTEKDIENIAAFIGESSETVKKKILPDVRIKAGAGPEGRRFLHFL